MTITNENDPESIPDLLRRNTDTCGFHITAFISIRMEKQNDETIPAFENGIRDRDEIVAC